MVQAKNRSFVVADHRLLPLNREHVRAEAILERAIIISKWGSCWMRHVLYLLVPHDSVAALGQQIYGHLHR
jgi:hypothetical protein